MYISFKNLELPDSYVPGPLDAKKLIEDIAYVKQEMGGFKELIGVDLNEYEYYNEWIFYDYILPKEIVVNYNGVPLLTKIENINNQEKYLIKRYKVITGGGNYVSKVYIDNKIHPHATSTGKYCFPQIVGDGKFSSFRFEKLRLSFFRWNLKSCFQDHTPQKEDFKLNPVFQEEV